MATKSLFRHILVPHDFSDQATVALATAGRLAKEHGGKLTVLHVLVPFYMPADVPFGMPAPGDLIPEQRQRLERLGTETLGGRRPPGPGRDDTRGATPRLLRGGPRAAPPAPGT